MKAIEIRDRFGVDSLRIVDRPDPVPGPGQVLLKMKAFSLNYPTFSLSMASGDGGRLSDGFRYQTALVLSPLRGPT